MFLDLQVGNLTEPLTGRCWDRREILNRVRRRIVYYQRHGLIRGDRVFIHYGNTLEFFADLLAVWSLGGCAIPIDTRLTGFEVEVLARAAKPRFSLWHGRMDEHVVSSLDPLQTKTLETSGADHPGIPLASSIPSGQVFLDQPALILFTSGTTGQPKGVVHTHRSLRARWISLRDHLGVKAFRRTLCLLPTHFGHGLICNCLFPWLSGQDLFLLPPFRADLVLQLGSIVDAHGITFLSSVPTVWRLALKTAKPPQSGTLERVCCGSAPLTAFLWKGIQEWTGTRDVLNAYGITEVGSWVAGTTVGEFSPEDGLIGVPWGAIIRVLRRRDAESLPDPDVQCEPGEAGHVWLHTPALMQAYLGREDLTRQVIVNGWFLTGDIGLLDDRGWLYLRGREREEINKGGMKIYPGDIDTVIERFQGVLDVCTFGYDDSFYGENVGIAIVLREMGEATLNELFRWASQHLGVHQLPQRWYVVQEIPRTSRGKVNRTKLAEDCAKLTPVDPRKYMSGEGRTGPA